MEELENEISTQAEENTVSLASAQALADALAKIEVYTPTTWVDNSSPDIDAEHLNKPEQAIKRVTDALNSAVDVIKDLQSQVTKNAGDISTVNNNLSKKLFVKISDTSNGNHSKIDQIADFYGITWVNSNYNSTFGGQWCFIDSTIVDNSGPYAMQRVMSCENAAILATRYCTKGTWGAWNVGVTKSDLNTVLMYRGVITGDLNRGRNLAIAPGIYSIQGASTIINGPSDFGGWGIFVQFPDNLFSQMILNSPNYIKFRKYSGSDPSWGAW